MAQVAYMRIASPQVSSMIFQIICLIIKLLMSALVVLLTDYLAQRHDPDYQAVIQRQFADMQAQLATFATHAAPIQAERIALRSV
jgi:hypothetical protein